MTDGQKLLAKLLVHNKLLSEGQCKKLFAQVADPEQALTKLAKAGHIKERVAVQLLEIYRQKAASLSKSDPGQSSLVADSSVQKQAAAKPKPAEKDPWDFDDDDPFADSGSAAPSPPAEQPQPVGKQPTPSAPPSAAAASETPSVGAESPAAESPASQREPARPRGSALPMGASGRELMHGILRAAREQKASDVHLTAGLPPSFRIAGRLAAVDMPALEPDDCREALLSILNPQQRADFEETLDIDFCYDGGEELGRFRSNYLEEHVGMDGVFRLINRDVPSFDELGLPDTVKTFTDYSVGIVLVTGPKSCGKTTTLAAMVDMINRSRAEHIITLEDPIEYVHPCKMGHVNQRELGTHTHSFANALRAALREAPDIIMVGEMRDLETTSLAITAAETGHLVLASLHTPDAVRTIGRVLDVFPPKEQGQIRAMLSESLRGIVSQQLVPNTNGDGQELALEILVNTPAIGNMIREDRTFQLRGMMQTGRRLGMVLMDESLINLVNAGKITKEEAVARATETESVMKELGIEAEE